MRSPIGLEEIPNSTYETTPPFEPRSDVTGTLYGVAWDRLRGRVILSAFVRRHAGLGPLGAGGLYHFDPNDPARTITQWVDVTTLGIPVGAVPSNAARGLTAGHTQPNADPQGWNLVGRSGLGDIEVSEDGTTLYLTSLDDTSGNQLYSIAIPADGSAPTGTAVALGRGGTCDKPFAIKPYRGKVYVGNVCTTGTPKAEVTAYDLNTSTWSTVITIPLNYTRVLNYSWQAWTSSFTNAQKNDDIHQPIFSDIEFDSDGSIIVAFRDRLADQVGVENYWPDGSTGDSSFFGAGDLLRICNTTGGLVLQGSAGCPNNFANSQGPGGGEYYNDTDPSGPSSTGHEEEPRGSLAILPGSTLVAASLMNADGCCSNGGVAWFNNATGAWQRAVEMQENFTGLFAKTNGMGDIEILADPAPLEVGNRLWCDSGSGVSGSNNNGIQDPGETVLPAGVNVTMTCGGQSATVATDANGEYLFTDAIWDAQTTDNEIPRSSSCTISVPTTGANGTAINNACGTTSPTVQNAAQPANGNASDTSNNPITDVADSDAAAGAGGNSVQISFTTGGPGANNHGLDIGFGEQASYDWGDLPDSTTTPTGSFPTRNTDSGPNHAISSNLYLGACVDADSDGQPDYQAGTDGSGGDDNDGSTAAAGSCSPTGDDEDGVTLATPLIAGAQACVAVTAVNTTGGAANLYGWIDFNGNGAFEAGEALTGGSGGTGGNFSGGVASVANNTSGSNTYCFQVPANATFSGGETHMRFRLTTDTLSGGTPWGGSATNGEVEDYYSQLACVGNYLWMDSGATANVQDDGDTAVANGTAVYLIWGGPDGLISTAGDNVTYSTTTGAGGIYSFCGVRPDANGDTTLDQYQVIVPTSPGTPVTPNVGSVAQDSNGTANGNASESNVFTVPVPNGVVDNAPNDSNPNGYPGNQTDLSIDFGFQPPVYDFGDAPDGAGGYPNQTVLANGARHLLNSALVLGTCVDSEADGVPVVPPMSAELPAPGLTDDGSNGTASSFLPSPAACNNVDDEDGFAGVNDSDWSDGSGSLNVSVSGVGAGGACVYGWIDFDQDGFDAGDATAQLAWSNADPGTKEMVFGSNVPVGNIPVGVPIYVRLRVVPGACSTLGPIGEAVGGEVEDHDITSSSATAVNLGEITTRMPIANLVWVIAAALILLTGLVVRLRRRPEHLD